MLNLLKGEKSQRSRASGFFAAVGAITTLVGAVVAGVAGFAPLGIFAVGAAAGVAGCVTSMLSMKYVERAGRDGNEGGMIKGIIAFVASHVVLVPAVATVAGYAVSRNFDKAQQHLASGALIEEFKGACEGIRQQENGAYVLPKGCTLKLDR